MEQFDLAFLCPECGCETVENENGNEVCFVCLREFTFVHGEAVEIETDIYQDA